MRSVQFGLCSIWNNYFSSFPLPPANEHSFNSSRFPLLIFTQSISNYQTDSWWDLFSLDIFILFAFLWIQLSWSYWLWRVKVTLSGFAFISDYQPLLLLNERLNKLWFTPLPTTVYLPHLLSLTPSHNLSCSRFSKCIRNKGCFIFLQEIGKRITISECWNRKLYSYLYQYKTSFPDRYQLHTLLVKP